MTHVRSSFHQFIRQPRKLVLAGALALSLLCSIAGFGTAAHGQTLLAGKQSPYASWSTPPS